MCLGGGGGGVRGWGRGMKVRWNNEGGNRSRKVDKEDVKMKREEGMKGEEGRG